MSIETNIADSRIAFLSGDYEKALELANQAIALDPKSADAYQCAANAYMSFGKYEEAIVNYTKALNNDADNGDRYFNLAYANTTDNQSVKALQMFAKADEVGCSPNVVGQLYKIMGMACFDMQRGRSLNTSANLFSDILRMAITENFLISGYVLPLCRIGSAGNASHMFGSHLVQRKSS